MPPTFRLLLVMILVLPCVMAPTRKGLDADGKPIYEETTRVPESDAGPGALDLCVGALIAVAVLLFGGPLLAGIFIGLAQLLNAWGERIRNWRIDRACAREFARMEREGAEKDRVLREQREEEARRFRAEEAGRARRIAEDLARQEEWRRQDREDQQRRDELERQRLAAETARATAEALRLRAEADRRRAEEDRRRAEQERLAREAWARAPKNWQCTICGRVRPHSARRCPWCNTESGQQEILAGGSR
jgi:hypothetical protein